MLINFCVPGTQPPILYQIRRGLAAFFPFFFPFIKRCKCKEDFLFVISLLMLFQSFYILNSVRTADRNAMGIFQQYYYTRMERRYHA